MYIRKTMVLSSTANGSEKAVLNLESERDSIVGSVRLYNFQNAPSGILSLGILSGGKVYKAGLTQKGKDLYTFETENITEISDNFSCAVVNIKEGKATPILMGRTDGKSVGVGDIKLASSISLLDEKPITIEKATEVLNNNQVEFEEQEKEEIEEKIDEALEECEGCDKCLSCKYRDAFYSEGSVVEIEKSETLTFTEDLIEEEKPEEKFFDEIKDQIFVLFDSYPEENFLISAIPNSKWVKVDYEDKGEYYVVGLIYENDEIKYVCYGIPSMYESSPPKEFSGECQWFPIDPERSEEFGYWLMYQDAETGESVEVDII